MKEQQQEDAFVSTKTAAQMLNVSVGTVQKMVEDQTLQAWKTIGGHRRVAVISIHALLNKLNVSDADSNITLHVVEDDPVTADVYVNTIKSWNLPIETIVCSSGVECVHQLSKKIPDLIITDLKMERMDGFELLSFIKSKPEYKHVCIMVVTGMDVEKVKKTLPVNLTVYSKPIPFHEIHGFVNALFHIKKNTC